MSMKVDLHMPMSFTRPTRFGNRRRPRSREMELLRPAPAYQKALCTSFARMSVIDRIRGEGFTG